MLEAVAETTGIDRRPEETPREYLRRVCEAVGCDQAQTQTVIEAAEAALFGPEGPTEAQRATVLGTVRDAQPAEAVEADEPSTPPGAEADQSADRGPDAAESSREEPSDSAAGITDRTGTAEPDSTSDTDVDGILARLAKGAEPLPALPPGQPADAFSEARARDSKDVGTLPRLLAFLPALALATLVFRPIPTRSTAAREIGVAAQALAFAEDGLVAYTYLTVQELPQSLHLGSWLASPLVAVGIVEGPRLVSAVAAVGTALVLFGLVLRLWAPVTAVLAVAVLWANPYWLRFAWAATPESLAILLTTAAVAVAVRYADSDQAPEPGLGPQGSVQRALAGVDPLGLGLLVLFLGFAVLQTALAAAVVVPVVALLAASDRLPGAVVTLLGAAVALVAVSGVTGLQPPIPARPLSVLETGLDVYATEPYLEFWAARGRPELYPLAHGLHLVGSAIVGLGWLGRWRSTGDEHALLLGGWLLAGFALPVALPGAALAGRSDLLWLTAVPLSLSVAVALGAGIEGLAWRRTVSAARVAVGVLVGVLVLAAVANALVLEAGVLTHTDDSGLQAAVSTTPVDTAPGAAERVGIELADRGVPRATDIAFVGDWRTGQSVYRSGAARVLLYGRLLPTRTWTLGPDHVRVVDSIEAAHPCAVAVVREAAGQLRIQTC